MQVKKLKMRNSLGTDLPENFSQNALKKWVHIENQKNSY